MTGFHLMRVLGVRGDDREGLKSQRYVLSKVGRVQILVWNFTQGSSFKNCIDLLHVVNKNPPNSIVSVKLIKCYSHYTTQKMKFSIKDFFSKCGQIRSFLRIWSHLLKKSLIENFIFWAVLVSPSNYFNEWITTNEFLTLI